MGWYKASQSLLLIVKKIRRTDYPGGVFTHAHEVEDICPKRKRIQKKAVIKDIVLPTANSVLMLTIIKTTI